MFEYSNYTSSITTYSTACEIKNKQTSKTSLHPSMP